jgi:prepilin-type N-terminal cleavage/methylation domain-containing protein
MIRRAFTIIELLVVTIIIALLALIAIPAFNAIIADSERSLAEEMLQTGIRTARAAAIKSGSGDDVVLAFQYVQTSGGGRTTMVVCRRAGLMEDFDSPNPNMSPPLSQGMKPREVFVPVPDVDPIQLPKGWMVRGYAKLGTVGYRAPGAAALASAGPYGWYETASGSTRYDADTGNWVFPETSFYDVRKALDGEDRQTFVLRFEAGTGQMTSAPFGEVLVLSVRPSQEDRDVGDQYRVDDAENDLRVVRAILDLPILSRQDPMRVRLLGSRSGDTILARPVSQIALYNERELASALGVRLDRDTGCLYEDGDDPKYVSGVDQADINAWIEGDTNDDGSISADGADPDVPLSRIYTVDRYTAFLTRLEVMQ